MTRITRANDSHRAFAFDYLTGFTPAFDGRSDFHNTDTAFKKNCGGLLRIDKTLSTPSFASIQPGMPATPRRVLVINYIETLYITSVPQKMQISFLKKIKKNKSEK